MDQEQVIQTLRKAMPDLVQRFPVSELSLFGSVARGDNGPGSDVDVLVRFMPGAKVTLFTLAGLLCHLEDCLGCTVDLVEDSPNLRPAFRSKIDRDRRRVA